MNNKVISQRKTRSNVLVFNFAGHDIRAIKAGVLDNHPWFMGKDVAKTLHLSNQSQAVINDTEAEDCKRISYKEANLLNRQAHDISDLWGNNDFMPKVVINKRGVFDLILNSRIPQAKKFKHWLTHKVLPQIDKTGNYVSSPVSAFKYGLMHMNEFDPNQLVIIMSHVAQRAAESNIAKGKRIKELRSEKDRMSSDYYLGKGLSSNTKSTYSNKDMAHIVSKDFNCHIGRNKFCKLMRALHIYGSYGRNYNQPFQYGLSHNWFEIHHSVYYASGFKEMASTVLITQKGAKGIISKMKRSRLVAGSTPQQAD